MNLTKFLIIASVVAFSTSLNSMQISPCQDLMDSIENNKCRMIFLGRYSTQEQNCSPLNEAKINEIFEKIAKNLQNNNEWTFVIFSENFFGDTNALDDRKVRYIVSKCNELTGSRDKVIVHATFLHEFNINNSVNWLKNYQMPTDLNRKRVINSRNITLSSLGYGLNSNNHVANYSLIVWKGRPISIYRKSTYCNESNDIFKEYYEEIGCCCCFEHNFNQEFSVYEFGDFQVHSLVSEDSEYSQMANIFSGSYYVTSRICSDLNFPDTIHYGNTKMLILPADEAPEWSKDNLIILRVELTKRMEYYKGRRKIGIVPKEGNYKVYYGCCFSMSDFGNIQGDVLQTDSFGG